MSVFRFEWLRTQERLNPNPVIIFDAAARYRRAEICSSPYDAHPYSSLHTVLVRPHTGFVEIALFISTRTGHGSRGIT
jgi:hypothetical protein